MADDTIRLGMDVGGVVASAKTASDALRRVADVSDDYDVLTAAQDRTAGALHRAAAAFMAEAEQDERAAAAAAGLVPLVERAADAYRVLSSAEIAAASSGIALADANTKLTSSYDVVGVTISKTDADARDLVRSQKLLVLSTAEVAAAVEAASDRETAAAVEATRARRVGAQMAAEAMAEMARRSKEADFEARRASYGVGTLSDMLGKLSDDTNAYTARTRRFRSGLEDVAKGTDRASRSTANMGRAMLETGRVVQDFTQGGIAGILNNIEGLTVAMGGGAGLAGALTVLGVGYFVFKEQLKDLYAIMVSGDKEISTQTDYLGRLNDELEFAKTRVKELQEQRRVSNEEDAEYRGLLGDIVKMEREANAERARRAELDKARKEEETKDYNKDSADAAKKAMQGLGGVDDTVQATRNALAATSPAVKQAKENLDKIEKENQAAATNPWNPLAQLKALTAIHVARRQRDEAMKQTEIDADDLVAKAHQGSPEASKRLDELIPGSGFDKAADADPELRKAQEHYDRQAREQAGRLAKYKIDASKKQADKARKKADRYRKYAEQDAENERSTPEEERLSAAMDAIDNRGFRMSDAEKLKAAKVAVDARDKRQSGERSIDAGVRSVQEDRAKTNDAINVAADERRIDQATGGQLTYDQLQQVTKRTRELVGRNVPLDRAFQSALNELVQSNQELLRKLSALNSGMTMMADQARFVKQQVRAMGQFRPSQLQRMY